MRCVSTVPSSVSVDDAGSRSLKDGLNEDDSADDDDDDVDVDVDVDVDAIRASLASTDVVNNRGESSSSFPFSEKWMFLFSFSFSLSSPSPDVDEKNSDKSEIGAGGRCRDVVLDLLLLQCCIILLRIDSDIYDERGG